MGAQVVRVGLLAQEQVIDVLNRYFVPVELNATADGGVPDDVPGLAYLRKAWEDTPWTRVSFGSEWVLEPGGQFLLSTGFHKHFTKDERRIAGLFQESLEKSLSRLGRLRSHERGSPEEAQERQRIQAEIEEDMRVLRPCWVDPDLGTKETLKILGRGKVHAFYAKLAGVFTYPDPEVRRKVAVALGRYADRYADEFRGSEQARFLGDRVAEMLDDEEPAVRQAAATALYQIDGRTAPGQSGAELEASARGMWGQRYEAAEGS